MAWTSTSTRTYALVNVNIYINYVADYITGREARGMVVTIYLDPENEQGSTFDTLHALEWSRGGILR